MRVIKIFGVLVLALLPLVSNAFALYISPFEPQDIGHTLNWLTVYCAWPAAWSLYAGLSMLGAMI